jgi:hypothetical protein
MKYYITSEANPSGNRNNKERANFVVTTQPPADSVHYSAVLQTRITHGLVWLSNSHKSKSHDLTVVHG